jgi:hypothetical protein
LLTGDRFYASADAALREVVLNAIDACGRRELIDSSGPDIRIAFDQSALTVRVEDNGVGMSRSDVTALFTTIGASAADMDEASYHSIGEFGVGMVSYFLVCDRFELHSLAAQDDPVGLVFDHSMLDGSSPALEIDSIRTERGTSIVFHVADQQRYDLLLDRYGYWFRGVDGLSGAKFPDGSVVAQGETTTPALAIEVDLPDWVEEAHIGAPQRLDSWAALDGRAHVDILYRGVFVQTHDVNGLWGISGSLWVDPKRLHPKLNRESFGLSDLVQDVDPFLRLCHPLVLDKALSALSELLELDDTAWSQSRLVSLWLALPRDDEYDEVVARWDDFFRNRKLFVAMEADDSRRPVSLTEVKELEGPIYLAPDPSGGGSDLVRAAIRVLRGTGRAVIQGVMRDSSYLQFASYPWQSDSELLINRFASELPEIRRLNADSATQILERAAGIYEPVLTNEPRVCLVHLGPESTPVIPANGELWINRDTDVGRQLVRFLCEQNQGRLSLLVACHRYAPDQVSVVAQTIGRIAGDGAIEHLGLLRREYLRGLVV